MIRTYDFAPLDGITKLVFRRVHHRMFGGADRYFIPFFSPAAEHLLTKRDRRELDPAANGGLPLVPQVMTRRAADFLWAAEVVEDLGYKEVDLNLGCPSGTVTAKGKGAGFLAKPDELDQFFEEVFSKVRLPVSVKTRLGVQSPEEFERLLDIYDRYPIRTLIIHPRVQKEFYKGEVHLDAFARALARTRLPVCYNGDLVTAADCAALEGRFPSVEAVMNLLVAGYLRGELLGTLTESYCSEQNARMTAMKSSSDNAREMLQELNLSLNRARQAAITQEINEVVGGAQAAR